LIKIPKIDFEFSQVGKPINAGMITKINKIKDFGVFKNFNGSSLTDFKTFNLIYGWNYSGKTTLSRVFRCLEKGKLHDDYKSATFEVAHQSGKYDNTFISTANIRVFNSDFIRENLKWDADNIEPILLLGAENIELQKKLEESVKKLKLSEEKLLTLRKEREEKEKKLKKALTDKARSIGTLLSLRNFDRDNLVRFVEAVQPAHSLSSDDFEKFKARAISTEHKPLIDMPRLAFLDLESQKNEVENILGKQVSSSNQIQKLLNDKALGSWVEQGKKLHEQKLNCEFCGNPLPYDLLDKLNKHFSKEYDLLKNSISTKIAKLEGLKINQALPTETAFYPDIQPEYQLTGSLLVRGIEDYNKVIDSFINDLRGKQLEPFNKLALTSVVIDTQKIEEALKNFNATISKNNKRTSDFDIEKNEAIEKIKCHFALEFEKEESYSATKGQLVVDQSAIDELTKDIEHEKKGILEIQSQLSETVKGASQINNYLKIFFGKDDVKIEATSDNKFKLIRGDEVAKNLSEGEKTAISFVYFTTKLEEQNNKLGDTIVYIDDPVSSLDSTHLFNIYSFIKNTFYQLVEDQNGGKIHSPKCKQLFISTHNFEFYNLIYDWFDKTKKDHRNYFTVERTRNTTKDESVVKASSSLIQKYKSEYAYLFSIIFNFHGTPSDTTESIYYLPNILRKFLETYLNFKFLTASAIDESIGELIPNQVDCERARKFMHYYSHSLTTESFMKFPDLAECSDAIRIVLEAIEKHDPIHYKSLTERVKV
jgi:wobble nucleotide-excising tRNase